VSARALLCCVGLALVSGSTAAAAHGVRPMGAAERVDGKRVDAYPALWWQWVNRKRWGAQAFQDPTGAQCALNQHGPVWFLAGTDGTDAVTRACRVPSGKHVFLPVITMLEPAGGGTGHDCAWAKSEAAANNEHVVATEIRVDGQPIPLDGLRMAAGCFDAYAEADYKSAPRGDLSATDGYWLMLAPFADGAHTLRVHVRYENPGAQFGDMEQDFEYRLDVGGPEPAATPDEDEDEKEPEETGEWLQASVFSRADPAARPAIMLWSAKRP
jgi:hypothetical protein